MAQMRRVIDMKCKYATPQTNHLPFKELQNLKSPQSKNWACFHFNIWTIHRENKLPLNFLFLPILQSVNMQASYQLCKTTQHTNMNQKPTPYGNGNSIKKRINNNRDAGWKLCKLHETTI